MAKTQEELKELKKECINLNTKLRELSRDELEQVTGGTGIYVPEIDAPLPPPNDPIV